MSSLSTGILYAAKFREGLKAETDITTEISNTIHNLCWLVRNEGGEPATKDPRSPTFHFPNGFWIVIFHDRSRGIVEEVQYHTCRGEHPNRTTSMRLMSCSPDQKTPMFVRRKYVHLKEIHSNLQYLINGMAEYLPCLLEPLRGYAELADYAASLKLKQAT